jgi:glucose-6-phosphate dehydrogenase assembly protein OpcA
MRSESKVEASVDAIRAELAQNAVSTSTLNFIVWIDDPQRRAWILERAGMLAEKHPSFTLILDNTAECGARATVTSSAREHPEATVRGERVDIDVSCLDAPAVGAYVAALCTAGVPTLLWWSGMKVESRPIFEALLPSADTLLVDSSGSVTDERGIASLVRFHRENPRVVIRDLAWLRLLPWRDMIANFFDEPSLARDLFGIRRLSIASGSAAEALYLAGWMGSALGWRATGVNAFTDFDDNTIRFVREQRGAIRRVQSVRLETETTAYRGEVTDDDDKLVRVWVEGQHASDPRLYPLQAIDNASLLERAVLETGADELFETALGIIGTILG